MKFFLVFAIVTCAFAHTIGRSLFEEKVIGGTAASEGQFPYQISMRFNGTHDCGGSIIDSNTVLTAAHCIYMRLSVDVTVVAGTNKLDQGGELYEVSRLIVHENYDPVNVTDDIAVIKVANPIQFTTYIQPIPIDDSYIPVETTCVLSGWGFTTYPGNNSNDLMYFEGRVISVGLCSLIYEPFPYPVLESNICIFSGRGIGSCSGDSGGPLVSNNKQVGVHSWGYRPCGFGAPGVATRLSNYVDWIRTQQEVTN